MLAACAKEQPVQPVKPAAPVAAADSDVPPVSEQPPVTETKPTQLPSAVPQTAPPSNEMDAATQAALDKNFKPGVKMALSGSFFKMKIGERKVIGVALRALRPEPDTYQIRFDLRQAYDKSRSIITSDFAQVKPFFQANIEDDVNNGFATVALSPNGEKKYPLIIDIKPEFADGAKTQPGTYELNIKVFNKDKNVKLLDEYSVILLTILVEP
jgi:hypothetical protein